MKKSYFMVAPIGERGEAFPILWEPHEQTLEEVFRSVGYPYTTKTPVEVRRATIEEVIERDEHSRA